MQMDSLMDAVCLEKVIGRGRPLKHGNIDRISAEDSSLIAMEAPYLVHI